MESNETARQFLQWSARQNVQTKLCFMLFEQGCQFNCGERLASSPKIQQQGAPQ
jgi:hypothetical protein